MRPRANDTTLNYVFPGGLRPSWKGNTRHNQTTGSAAATSSQPETNLSVHADVSLNIYERSFRGGTTTGRYLSVGHKNRGPLNPIKQWRKQLQPSQGHITGKPTVNQVMWQPGGTVHLGIAGCVDSSCAPVISNYLYNSFALTGNTDPSCCNVLRNSLSNYQPVVLNNPARVIRPRSSQTMLKKNYHTTTKAYLRSRVKLYEQNQLLSQIQTPEQLGFQYPGMPPAGNNYVYPVDDISYGTQAFHSTQCVSDPSMCCVGTPQCATFVVFKPNNPFFSVQGAVDSSTRTLQRRYAAITKNQYDFTQGMPVSIGGVVQNTPETNLQGATPVTYRGVTSAPYFVKSRYQWTNICATGGPVTSRCARANVYYGRMPSGGSGITFPNGFMKNPPPVIVSI